MTDRYTMSPELLAPASCDHDHQGHQHNPFPPAEEDLYMKLVGGAGEQAPEVTAAVPHAIEHRIADIQARLPRQWSILSPAVSTRVAQGFAAQYESLPTSHPLFEHQHSHDGDHQDSHSCGKVHGPLRRRFDALEAKVLDRISHRTAKAVAAAVFRLSALTVCPGDDIAAIGLQVHSAMAGHHEAEHGHHEEQAILPRKIRIEAEQHVSGPDDSDTAT